MQLWKLIKYELKKTVCNKFFTITFFLLFVVNIMLWCEHWEAFGDGRKVTKYTKAECALLESLSSESLTAFKEKMIEQYGADVFSPSYIPTMEMMSPPGYFGEQFSDFGIINTYVALQQMNEENEALYQNVLKAAKQFGREALEEGNDYEVRRNQSIIRLYSVPRPEINCLVCSWNDFLFGRHTMLLALLLIFQSGAGMFTKEISSQTWLLLHTSKNGKGKTLASKFFAAGIIAVATVIVFQGSSMLMIHLNYGLLGAAEPVSAIQGLELFPFSFTVGQYVLLTMLCQMWAAIVISVLFCTVSAISGSGLVSYIVNGFILGGSFLLVNFSPDSEWLTGPLALIRPEKYFESYYTVNILGYPVMGVLIHLIIDCVVGIGCIILSAKVYHRKRRKI